MIRKILATIALAASVMLGLTACTGSPASTATVPNPSQTTTASDEPAASSTISSEDEKAYSEALKAWGVSSQRKVLFKDAEIAQVVVAKALEAGQFGKLYRYNEWKADWVRGQEGWGGMSTPAPGNVPSSTSASDRAYAWVYFRADGSVNYAKGVKGFSIDMGSEFLGIQVEDESVTDGVKHDVFMDKEYDGSGQTYVTCFEHCGFGIAPNDNDAITTWDAEELADMETTAMQELDANMTAAFGANWRVKPVWQG